MPAPPPLTAQRLALMHLVRGLEQAWNREPLPGRGWISVEVAAERDGRYFSWRTR